MSKKTQDAAAVQAPASTDEATADQVEQQTEQPSAQDGTTTEQPAEQVRGRALVDLPAHGIKCGEFGNLPAAIAQSLEAAGEFDPWAVEA